METVAHQALTANSTSPSFSKDISKLPNVQLRSPDTPPNGNISDALRVAPGGARNDDQLKHAITAEEVRAYLNGSVFNRLLSPASERSTPGQLRSNRFSRDATSDHAPSPKLSFSKDFTPTNINYQSLPSPPEPVVVGYVDRDFGHDVQQAYDISIMREKWRLNKYGEIATKFKRGFTPSPLRRAYWERHEESLRLDEQYTTDSEPSSPDSTHRAYLSRQEEYVRVAKSRIIESEPPSPIPRPAGLNDGAKHQVSEACQASDMTSGPHITEHPSEEHLLQEAQVSPLPVSLPAYSDVAVDQEISALHAIGNQDLDEKAGSKRRRDATDDGSKQEVLLEAVSHSVKERQFKRVKRDPGHESIGSDENE